MISSMKIDIDFTKDFLAITTEDTPIDKLDEGIKVYIPLLMCEIEKDEPKYKQLKSAPLNILKNDITCKPKYKSTIKEQNYFIAKKEDNVILNNLLIKKDNKDILPKNTKLQANFIHGRINSLIITDILI